MIRFKNLRFSESINQEKLVFDESWFSKLDRLLIYMFFFVCFILPFLIYFDPHRNNNKTGTEYYLVFFFSIFSIYVIYRKASEKKLVKVLSDFDIEKNRTLINEYCKKLGYEKYKDSKNIIIYNKEPFMNINSDYRSSRIFLLKDNIVYFTMIKDNFKLNVPVLFSQIELYFDLKKLMTNKLGSS